VNKHLKLAAILLLILVIIFQFVKPSQNETTSQLDTVVNLFTPLLCFYLICSLLFESNKEKKKISNIGIELTTDEFLPWNTIERVLCSQEKLKFNEGIIRLFLKKEFQFDWLKKDAFPSEIVIDSNLYYKSAWEIIESARNKNIEIDIV